MHFNILPDFVQFSLGVRAVLYWWLCGFPHAHTHYKHTHTSTHFQTHPHQHAHSHVRAHTLSQPRTSTHIHLVNTQSLSCGLNRSETRSFAQIAVMCHQKQRKPRKIIFNCLICSKLTNKFVLIMRIWRIYSENFLSWTKWSYLCLKRYRSFCCCLLCFSKHIIWKWLNWCYVTVSKQISPRLREVPFSTQNRYVFLMGEGDMNVWFFAMLGFIRSGGGRTYFWICFYELNERIRSLSASKM